MALTPQQIASMREAAKPLVEWLNENVHPHHIIVVDSSSAELHEQQVRVSIDEFLKE